MNAAWKLGYEDARQNKPRAYENGPVGVVGVVAFDYSAGYKAGNTDNIWTNTNRPPMSGR